MSSIEEREMARAVTDGMLEAEYLRSTGLWQQRLRIRRIVNWGILIIALVVIISASFFFSESRKADIAKTWDIVKPGDKIYVQDYFLTDTTERTFIFARKIRPITLKDIGAMHIPLAQKRKMAAQLDTTLKKAIMEESSRIAIPRANMFKYGTACIGVFLGRDSTTAVSNDDKEDKWYIVRPNKLVISNGYIFDIPKGYILANKNYYIDPQNIQLTEPKAIKRFNPHSVVTTTKPIHLVSTKIARPVKHHKKRKRKRKQAPVRPTAHVTQDSL